MIAPNTKSSLGLPDLSRSPRVDQVGIVIQVFRQLGGDLDRATAAGIGGGMHLRI